MLAYLLEAYLVLVLAYLLLVLFLTASWCTRGEGARALTSLKTAKSPARTGRSAALRPGADLDVVLARLRGNRLRSYRSYVNITI